MSMMVNPQVTAFSAQDLDYITALGPASLNEGSIAALEQAREPWFNVNVGDGFYHYHRSWNDPISNR